MIKAFLANLKKSIRNNEELTIGGGIFSAIEMQEILDKLENSPLENSELIDYSAPEMKLSEKISEIALGNMYDEIALMRCLSMKLILRDEYFDAIQRYLAGNSQKMDFILLQDISVCLHKAGA